VTWRVDNNSGVVPGVWDGYRGFIIYAIPFDLGTDESVLNNASVISTLTNCVILTSNCEDNADTQPSSAIVTGLDPNQQYRMHVRAYDDAPITNYTLTDIVTKSRTVTVKDETNPVFQGGSSGLSALYDIPNKKIDITWSTATDNQVAGSLTYKLYRRKNNTFTDANQLTISFFLADVTDLLSYEDSFNLESNSTYDYGICAEDEHDNIFCDSIFPSQTLPDIVPPVIADIASTKTKADWEWNLSWTLSDAGYPDANHLVVNTYKQISDTETTLTEADIIGGGLIDITASQNGKTAAENLTSPTQSAKWNNYIIRVFDGVNQTFGTISVFGDNSISIDDVRRRGGNVVGGDTIYIRGNGFYSGTTIDIGGAPCNSPVIYTQQTLTCTATANSAGPKLVTVNHPDNVSTGVLSNGYEYTAGDYNICDQAEGSPFQDGAGTPADPFIVCTVAQFENIANNGSYKSYKLGANLDFNNTIHTQGHLNTGSIINGDGHVILNAVYTLFYYQYELTEVRDLAILGFDSIDNDTSYHGIFSRNTIASSFCYASEGTWEDIIVQAKLTVTDGQYLGGLAGFKICGTMDVNRYSKNLIDIEVNNAGTNPSVRFGGMAMYGNHDFTMRNTKITLSGDLDGTSGHTSSGAIFAVTLPATYIIEDCEIIIEDLIASRYVGGLNGSSSGAVKSLTIVNTSFDVNIIHGSALYSEGAGFGGISGSLHATNIELDGITVKSKFDRADRTATGGAFGHITIYDNADTTKASTFKNITVDTDITIAGSDSIHSARGAGGFVGRMLGRNEVFSNIKITGKIRTIGTYTGGFAGVYVAHANTDYMGTEVALMEKIGVSLDIESAIGTKTYAGGLFGQIYSGNEGTANLKVRKSYFDGSFTAIGSDSRWGGFASDIRDGYSGTYFVPLNLVIEEFANMGTLSVSNLDVDSSSARQIAGILGEAYGVHTGITITDSYSLMSANAAYFVCGLMCGKTDPNTPVTVTRYYSVIDNLSDVIVDNGGFVASTNGSWSPANYSISNSFWDETTSGTTTSGEGTVAGQPTATLKSNSFWTTEGFFTDVPVIWTQTEGEYPRLADPFFPVVP
jgi:hypothetical protein